MEIIKGQTIHELNEGDLELQGCKIDSISGVAEVNLVDCVVGSISGYAAVTMSRCKINTIDENVGVEKAVDCLIKTIKGNVLVNTISSSTVGVITDRAAVRKIDDKCVIKLLDGNSCIHNISHSEIKRIAGTAVVDIASDCAIKEVTDNSSVISAGPDVNIDVVNNHANLGFVRNSHIYELSGNNESFRIENSTIDHILGNVIVDNMKGCTSSRVDESVTIRSTEDCVIPCTESNVIIVKSKNSSKLFNDGEIESFDNIESSVVIGKHHNCMIPDKDTVDAKHSDEYTLTQDTTPTLWKQVNIIKDDLEKNMKTLTVLLADFYTESHNNTIVKTLELLNGVNIIRRNNSKVEIECSDEALEVISAMYLYDYMMVEELLEKKYISSKNTQNAEDVSIRVLSREEAHDLDRYMNAMLPNGVKLVGAEHTPTHANNKTYDSIVDGDWILTNCTVKHIGGTANVILKGCTVDTISGNAVVELSTGDTINSISDAAILQKAVGSTVHSITDSVLLHSFERGKIDFINTSTQLWDIEKSTILHITGDTHIVNIHDSTINSIAGHTRVDTIDNTLVSEIGDYAVIKLIHECSVRELKGSAIIQLVDASKIYNVSIEACIVRQKIK